MNVRFLHDSEPGQQGLQVVLTGQVVIQRLRIMYPLALHTVLLHTDCDSLCCLLTLTVMICALSSGERVNVFGFPLKSRWKACMALAVTSCRKNK